jgi:Rhs element Vgr protein
VPEATRVESAAAKDAATFSLKVNGQAVSDEVRVAGIIVYKAIGKIPFARIEILDGDPSAQTFEISSGDVFVPGGELEVLTGYRSEETPVFKGVIVSQQLRVRTPGPSILTVYARHPLLKATLTRRSRTFANMTDDSAISTLFSGHGVTLSNSASGLPQHEALVQSHCTDWDFALARAEANGLFLIPTDEGAELAPPASGDPVLSLLFGATVIELDAEMDARTQPSEATGLAWDPAAQEAITSTGDEPALPGAGNLDSATLSEIHGQPNHVSHPGAIAQDDLDAFASARLLRQRLARINGRVRCEGTPAPLPGTILELNGLGDRFSGKLLISAVRQTLASGVWQTDIQFGLPPEPLLEKEITAQPPAAGMLPAVHDLAIGIVTAISSDPASELRVQVTIPSLGEGAAPLWARLAKFDAGSNRGACFYPEIDDEVVVGFLAGDPRHPVVLGSLYSSSHSAPLAPEDSNAKKGYVSREGLRFVFDDQAKSITLETPNGNKIILSDETGGITIEDENGNKVVLSSEGISVESATELALKSGTNAKVDAGANLELGAAAQLSLSATASLEVSASGTAAIKGAIIQLN